jgi:hypothetical protein
MDKTYTFEQIQAIAEEAMRNCLKPVGEENTVTDYMQKSFNNGVSLMQKELIYQLLLKEVSA